MIFSLTKQNKEVEENDFTDAGTIIGTSVKVTGDLVSEGDVQIDGVLEGSVRTSKSIIIGPTAQIKGKVFGSRVIVSGNVTADIVATEELQILSTGKVFGNIQSKLLGVEPGAVFVGKSEILDMGEDNEKSENKQLESPDPVSVAEEFLEE